MIVWAFEVYMNEHNYARCDSEFDRSNRDVESKGRYLIKYCTVGLNHGRPGERRPAQDGLARGMV